MYSDQFEEYRISDILAGESEIEIEHESTQKMHLRP